MKSSYMPKFELFVDFTVGAAHGGDRRLSGNTLAAIQLVWVGFMKSSYMSKFELFVDFTVGAAHGGDRRLSGNTLAAI